NRVDYYLMRLGSSQAVGEGESMSSFRGNTRFLLASCILAAIASAAAVAQTAPYRTTSAENQRTAWYRDAKFGMFIHWGPYSLASVEASWPIMRPSAQFPITQAEYTALPARFNPVHFDPYAWVALAKAAGQRYIVFTTKHHDGFCMFDSSYTDCKITKTPYGKDIVAQLAEACHRQQILERGAHAPRMAGLSRLHGTAASRASDSLWRCGADLARRPLPSGKIRWRPHGARYSRTAAANADQQPHRHTRRF